MVKQLVEKKRSKVADISWAAIYTEYLFRLQQNKIVVSVEEFLDRF